MLVERMCCAHLAIIRSPGCGGGVSPRCALAGVYRRPRSRWRSLTNPPCLCSFSGDRGASPGARSRISRLFRPISRIRFRSTSTSASRGSVVIIPPFADRVRRMHIKALPHPQRDLTGTRAFVANAVPHCRYSPRQEPQAKLDVVRWIHGAAARQSPRPPGSRTSVSDARTLGAARAAAGGIVSVALHLRRRARANPSPARTAFRRSHAACPPTSDRSRSR